MKRETRQVHWRTLEQSQAFRRALGISTLAVACTASTSLHVVAIHE